MLTFFLQKEPLPSVSDSLTDGCSYDELDFMNSVKNGKNAVLSAVGQKGGPSTSGTNTVAALARHHLGKQSNMNPVDLSDLPISHTALKDVMKMIAVRNIRMEDAEVAAGTSSEAGAKPGSKTSRRTLGKWKYGKFSYE